MADTTYYVNDSDDTTDPSWGAGSDSNSGLTKLLPFATLTKVIDGHASNTPGDTVTATCRKGSTIAAHNLKFDNGSSKHNGYNFVITGEDGEDFTTTSNSSAQYIAVRPGTSLPSLKVTGMILPANVSAAVFAGIAAGGSCIDLTLTRCQMAGTTLGSSFVFLDGHPATAGDSNISLIDCEVSIKGSVDGFVVSTSTADAGQRQANDILISGGSYYSPTAGAGISGIEITGTFRDLTIKDTSISVASGGATGVLFDTEAVGRNVTISNLTASGGTRGVAIRDSMQYVLVENSDLHGSINGLEIGQLSPTSVKRGIGQISVKKNTLTGDSASGYRIGFGADSSEVEGNTIDGGSHVCLINSDKHHVFNNIIKSSTSGSPGITNFGINNHIHNNTVKLLSGTALLTGNGASAGEIPYGHDNMIYNNILVSLHADGTGILDYEGHASGGIARGADISLDETTTATTWDVAGITMTGTGSAWQGNSGANLVKEVNIGDVVRIASGTNVVAGDYYIQTVGSALQITLASSASDGVGAPASVVYTIVRSDQMRDYIDYNCYWTLGAKAADINKTTTSDLATLQGLWDGWNEVYPLENDQHSYIEDPLLDSNYISQNKNLEGRPDINGNSTSMGAIQAGTETTTEISIMGPTVINVLGPN